MHKFNQSVGRQFGVSGREDDRQFWISLPNFLGEFESIHPRHGIIGDHDVERRIGFQQLESVRSGLSLGDAVTEIEQHVGCPHAHQYIVVDQQNAQAFRFLRVRKCPAVGAGADQAAAVGATVSLDPASFSDAGANDTHSAQLDWGDGTVVAGTVGTGSVSGSHAYGAPGAYTVTVTVTDDDGGTGSDTLVVTVSALPNDPPVVDAGADDTGTEGGSVALSGSVTDPDDSPTLLWTATPGVGVDAGAACTFGTPAAAVTTVTCTDDGTFTLTLTADDGTNPPVADSLVLTLANADPAVGAGADQAAAVGATVSLDPASFSDAGANDTHSAQLDWGDGTVVAGTVGTGSVSGSHAYGAPGAYTVTVTVTDDDGGTGSDTFEVTVEGPSLEVNTTDDTVDAAGCTFSHCSLREAIARANSVPGEDTITFGIDDTAFPLVNGAHVISPATALPAITDPTVIDGTSDGSFASCADGPVIELDGSGTGGVEPRGLVLVGAGAIRGLAVNDFYYGISLHGPSVDQSVHCSYIGTDTSGMVAEGNYFGIYVESANPRIGGIDPDDGNLISGNEHSGVYVRPAAAARIQGNSIGLDATGTSALPNGYGVLLTGAEGTLVGGTEAGAGNVVSGNQVGIAINGTGKVVQGNEIGRTGVGNLQYGVAIWSGGSDNLIGGTEPGEGNSIAFNLIGVRVMDATTTGNRILGNAIHSNGRLGIDLGAEGVTLNDSGDADTGPNGLQNFPELTSVEVTGASGTLDSGGASYRIEFFRNPPATARAPSSWAPSRDRPPAPSPSPWRSRSVTSSPPRPPTRPPATHPSSAPARRPWARCPTTRRSWTQAPTTPGPRARASPCPAP